MNRRGLRNRATRRTPIGLDVGASSIKAIQFEPYSTGLRVAAAALIPRALAALPAPTPREARDGREPRDRRERDAKDKAAAAPIESGPPSAGEIRALSDTLFRAGFEGQRLVVAAPPASLLQSVLELPPRSSNAPLDQIARAELARAHKVAPGAVEIGCWDLPPAGAGSSARAGKGTLVMAVGCAHAGADALLDAFESQGLVIEALDVGACALARACAPASASIGPEGGMTAILDMGWSAAALILLHCGAVIYGRTLADAGLATLQGTLTRRLGLEREVVEYLLTEVGLSSSAPQDADRGEVELPDDARGLLASHIDEVVRELLASFSYAARQYPEASVNRLLLVGGGAAIPELGEHLSAVLGVESHAVAPAEVAAYDAGLIDLCQSPVMTLATGLAQFPEL